MKNNNNATEFKEELRSEVTQLLEKTDDINALFFIKQILKRIQKSNVINE